MGGISQLRGHRAAALFLGLCASLVLGELSLRVLRPPQLCRIRYPCIYRPDETLGFRYLPESRGVVAGHFEIYNEVETNSLGFYDDEPLDPGRSNFRVLAVGDSFTAAMNVKRDEVWTSVLERELRRRGPATTDVVNLGIDGTGTDVHLELIRDHLTRFDPHLVILAFYGNDVIDVMNGRFERECYRDYVLSYQSPGQRRALRARVDAHYEKGVRRWLFEHSYLARLLNAAVNEPLNPYRIQFLQPRKVELAIDARTRKARQQIFRTSLQQLEEISRSCDCRLLVVPVPAATKAEASLRIWRRNAGEAALEVLDLVPRMEKMRVEEGRAHSELYFEHDNHFNAYGNALYGRALAEELLAQPRAAE